jgi:hypothetical protein
VGLDSGILLQRELPGSELVVLPGGGHILFEEFPEECNRIMVEWLNRDLSGSWQMIQQAPRSSFTPAKEHPPRNMRRPLAAH